MTLPAPSFKHRLWINDELTMERARFCERQKLGRVVDDGEGGPALWLPATDPLYAPNVAQAGPADLVAIEPTLPDEAVARDTQFADALAYSDLCGDDGGLAAGSKMFEPRPAERHDDYLKRVGRYLEGVVDHVAQLEDRIAELEKDSHPSAPIAEVVRAELERTGLIHRNGGDDA